MNSTNLILSWVLKVNKTVLTRRSFSSLWNKYSEEFREIKQRCKNDLDIISKVNKEPKTLKLIENLRIKSASSNLWDNPKEANVIVQQLAKLEERENTCNDGYNKLEEYQEIYDLSLVENEDELLEECISCLKTLSGELRRIRKDLLLCGPNDPKSCYLEILAGSGGTDSCDWSEMLGTMYLRWANRKNINVQILSETPGEEAGFRSIVYQFDGSYSYGRLKTEAGVHRLVRISPFDNQSRRHTSFAQVRVFPILDSGEEIVINSKDIRIDSFKSSGPGGQHVNTTDSAIRITHIPTGLTVQCQSDRSQHRNRTTALKMLQTKLNQLQLEKEDEQRKSHTLGLGDNTWGNQIRSVVLHPYQMVKDHRSEWIDSNPNAYLNGEIDRVIESVLEHFFEKKC